MKRRDFIGSLAAGGLASVCAPLFGAAESERPNILFIFCDDLSTRAIGAYGSGLHDTPNMDRLAAEGALFENSFCENSICQPSRAAVLTGKYSHEHGVLQNGSPWDGSQDVFTRRLSRAGYQTALFGKWHMHPDPTTEFDQWEILAGMGMQGAYYNPDFRSAGGERVGQGYSTDLITDRSLRWLRDERDPGKPFCLMCQYKAPHVPRMPPLRYLDRYRDKEFPVPETYFDDYETRHHADTAWMRIASGPEWILNIFPPGLGLDKDHPSYKYLVRMSPETRQRYLQAYEDDNREFYRRKGEGGFSERELALYRYQRFIADYLRIVDAIDENVGRLLKYLHETGLEKDTLVVFSADQSYFTGEHGWAEKRWMYEDGMRMPLIMRFPGRIRKGSRPDALVQNIDYAPTMLDVAGVEIPEAIQGRSLTPFFDGEAPADWRDAVYYHYYHHGAHNVPRHEGVRTDRYKLINFYTDGKWEMFDLESDPHEVENVYDNPEYKQVVKQMKQLLARKRAEAGLKGARAEYGASQASANLLCNPGFESGLGNGWNSEGEVPVRLDEGDALRSGEHAATFTFQKGMSRWNSGRVVQDVEVEGGERYELAGWVRVGYTRRTPQKRSEAIGKLEVTWLDGRGRPVGSGFQSADSEEADWGYERIMPTLARAPKSAVRARFSALALAKRKITSPRQFVSFDDLAFGSIPDN